MLSLEVIKPGDLTANPKMASVMAAIASQGLKVADKEAQMTALTLVEKFFFSDLNIQQSLTTSKIFHKS